MEKGILDRLEWNLTVPTPYVFLVRFLKAAASGDKEVCYFELMIFLGSKAFRIRFAIFYDTVLHLITIQMEHMGNFFAELALMQYSMILYCPSMVAASAVYAAQCTLNKSPLWNERLKRHTGFSEHQLLYV